MCSAAAGVVCMVESDVEMAIFLFGVGEETCSTPFWKEGTPCFPKRYQQGCGRVLG